MGHCVTLLLLTCKQSWAFSLVQSKPFAELLWRHRPLELHLQNELTALRAVPGQYSHAPAKHADRQNKMQQEDGSRCEMLWASSSLGCKGISTAAQTFCQNDLPHATAQLKRLQGRLDLLWFGATSNRWKTAWPRIGTRIDIRVFMEKLNLTIG